jgi:hypothetical protein
MKPATVLVAQKLPTCCRTSKGGAALERLKHPVQSYQAANPDFLASSLKQSLLQRHLHSHIAALMWRDAREGCGDIATGRCILLLKSLSPDVHQASALLAWRRRVPALSHHAMAVTTLLLARALKSTSNNTKPTPKHHPVQFELYEAVTGMYPSQLTP